MKKELFVFFLLPCLLFAHIKDERQFKTIGVPSSAMVLLDRSGSMAWETLHYETIARLLAFRWAGDNRTHLSGWYDSTITPDGPGTMSDFAGDSANSDWILDVTWYSGWRNRSIDVSWTLKIKSDGTWHTYDGGSHSWSGRRWQDRQVIIPVSGLGLIEDVECFVDVTTHNGLTIGWTKINLAKTPRATPYKSTRIKDAILVIHSLLDADNDGLVTLNDELYLPVQLAQGCHRASKPGDIFVPEGTYDSYNFSSPGQGYYGSNVQKYSYNETSKDWEEVNGDFTMYTDPIGSHFVDIWNHINYTDEGGSTPNGKLIYAATKYVNEWRSNHPELWCMKHNLIVITDGESNTPIEDCANGSNDIVRQAYKAWHSDSVKVFAVGFGEGITAGGANELNWAAFHGGSQKQDSTFIDSMINQEGMDTTAVDGSTCSMSTPSSNFLTGYAYIAKDAEGLASALTQIFMEISGQASFSYSSGEVTSVQEEFLSTEYESRLFIASFNPDSFPIWKGNLRAIKLDTGEFYLNAVPPGMVIWSAKDSLKVDMTADGRNIYGVRSDGNMLPFNASNFDTTDLGVSTTTMAADVIDRVRDGLKNDNKGELGDIFHSSPLRIHAPNYFYVDQGFNLFYNKMKERSAILYAGGNDGMLHVFADSINGQGMRGGEEIMGIIPMNFVPKVKNLLQKHDYFVDDGPIAADVWFPENDLDSLKQWDEWHTILIACQGEGGQSFTALDVTDPLGETSHPMDSITFLFNALGDSILKDTLGFTTSTPVIHKVGVSWVLHPNRVIDRFYAFMGGGQWPEPMDMALLDSLFSGGEIKGNAIITFDVWDVIEKGINGNVHLIPPISRDAALMNVPFPATPAVINIDPDKGNRYDFLFIPDAAGQLWFVDVRNPNPSKWEAECIFGPELPTASDSTELTKWHPAFYRPLAWKDPVYGDYWITYGTGNRSDVFQPSEERFYALHYPDSVFEDTSVAIPVYTESDLGTPGSGTDEGWMLLLKHQNEKVMTQPVYYQDSLKFLTFSPGTDTLVGPCELGGTGSIARSYIFKIRTGETSNIAGTPEGTGIPQPPRYSYSLGGTGVEIIQTSGKIKIKASKSYKSYKEIIKWREEE